MSSAKLGAEPVVSGRSVARVMGLVLLALSPGALGQIWLQGAGLAWQLLIAIGFGVGFEAVLLFLRGRAVRPFLGDLSAPLAAVLLALLLPVPMPWWILGAGVFAAIVLAKQLYGGLGSNLFNPAMVGYAVLLICFPTHFDDAIGSGLAAATNVWLAGLYALGGVFLIWKRVIPWHTPVAFLLGTAVAVMVFRFAQPSPIALDSQDLFSGSLMLAAFFIVTDPVTGCFSSRGRICFSAGAGLLTVLLARWGNVAEGLPFAVLLMNCAAPWLDLHTRPRRLSVGVPR